MYDYSKEPRYDMLCIDVKSFYASVECVERGLHPLSTMLVVMSNAENAGGLILAASPKAKEVLGISNISRKYDIPPHPSLIIVPPRMGFYIKKNTEINGIFQQYVSEEDLYIYSIDESFVSIQSSLRYFKTSPLELAKRMQDHIYKELGLVVTIGLGDNMLLAKLALDNEAKRAPSFLAEWRYEDVPEKLWTLPDLTDMWGIGKRQAARLNHLGIHSVYDLAHADYYQLKNELGVIGEQLQAHAWGIDRSNIRNRYKPADKGYGNSQVLPRDYMKKSEILIVLREVAEQVATRLRRHHCQTSCVHLSVGYSWFETERGFSRQMKIPPTSNSRELVAHVFEIFEKHYRGQAVRNVGVSYTKLVPDNRLQFSLFEDPEKQLVQRELDTIIDRIRTKYGFRSLIHASSLLEGATAINRSSLIGGHAGGMEGIK